MHTHTRMGREREREGGERERGEREGREGGERGDRTLARMPCSSKRVGRTVMAW